MCICWFDFGSTPAELKGRRGTCDREDLGRAETTLRESLLEDGQSVVGAEAAQVDGVRLVLRVAAHLWGRRGHSLSPEDLSPISVRLSLVTGVFPLQVFQGHLPQKFQLVQRRQLRRWTQSEGSALLKKTHSSLSVLERTCRR